MRLEAVVLREVVLPLLAPFEGAAVQVARKRFVLVEARAGGQAGWGECVALETPFYTSETVETAWHILHDFLAPAVLQGEVNPPNLPDAFQRVKGHPMAKAALETALWDLEARVRGQALAEVWGANREAVPAGVSLGLAPSLDELFRQVDRFLEQGYRRVKVKVVPGRDLVVLEALRNRYGPIPLMVDANGAYTWEDLPRLQAMDAFDLLMIEEPLGEADLEAYARLQATLRTPII